jgi:hypothetical protein
VVTIAITLRAGEQRSYDRFLRRPRVVLFSRMFRPALKATQTLIQCTLTDIFLGGKVTEA